MKKNKNTFKLNKQKVASLDKELKNNVKGGSRGASILRPTTTITDPTAGTFCFVCDDFEF